MKVLTSNKEIRNAIKSQIRTCSQLVWAVAWASPAKDDELKLLLKHRDKIEKLVVGRHFYQTHPDFVEAFYEHERVRFWPTTDGVFHPKVYLFCHHDGTSDALIGSANFTEAAMSRNYEVMLHINSTDTGGQKAIAAIKAMIDSYWTNADQLTAEDVRIYRDRHEKYRKVILRLSGIYKGSRGPSAQLSHSCRLNLTWTGYYRMVRAEKIASVRNPYKERLALLEHAKKAFSKYEHFKNIPLESRKIIGGFAAETHDQHWRFFGSTRGAGSFKALIANANAGLSDALDGIPLEGYCTTEALRTFSKMFQRVYGRNGLGCGTRLLALKRPDLFLCVNSRNSVKLSDAMGIRKSCLTGHDCWRVYVDVVLPLLRDCPWYISKKPLTKPELHTWHARMAMVDSLIYTP